MTKKVKVKEHERTLGKKAKRDPKREETKVHAQPEALRQPIRKGVTIIGGSNPEGAGVRIVSR